jgi:hypothetical protein
LKLLRQPALARLWSRRRRQASQNLVEFGLGVAAVAFVALVGFNALGTAQTVYWHAVVPSFAQPTPRPGPFIHPTTVTISPTSCNQGTPYQAGQTITCTGTVKDVYPTNPRSPRGTLTWNLDSKAPVSCSLAAAGSDSSRCRFTYTWTAADAAAPSPHLLVASYTPDPSTNNYAASTSPTLSFTVVPPPPTSTPTERGNGHGD